MAPRSSSGVEVAALPEATAPAPSEPAPSVATREQKPAPRALAKPAAAPHEIAKGETIEVAPGDTLYGLSRKHQVSLAELMSVNGLATPNLKPGQKLSLPAGKGTGASYAAAAPAAAVAAAPSKAAEAPAVALAPPTAAQLAKYNGTYVVKPGDSLYQVARAHKVQFSELQQVNGITDPRKVKPGATLKVPAAERRWPLLKRLPQRRLLQVAAAAPIAPAAAAAEQAAQAPATTPSTSTQPTIINANRQVAALNDKATDAGPQPNAPPTAPAPAAAAPDAAAKGTVDKSDKLAVAAPPAASEPADTSKLRWPAQGKIIMGFGGRPDGTHNDGINLSVPQGTEVHAAEGGVVAYAGSELKGYGNLVLVRHDNGWVTAYAHNEELLVKRGDKVKRGQVIAKAGKTGTVDQPQVHFELRQGSKPVDPTPFMEKI